jgi:hypothetical protein
MGNERSKYTVPVVVGSLRTPRLTTILILQGNTVLSSDTYYGTIYGCKIPSSGVTAVPSATPSPSAGGTYADGLCCGSLFDGTSSAYVWVANKVSIASVDHYDVVSTMVEGMIIQSRLQVRLPITGGGGTTAEVFLPWYIG